MQWVIRASLVLSLVVLLNATSGLRKKAVRLELDSSVMSHVGSTMSSSVANMSLSPWEYRDSYETSRRPMRISHAHCLTSGCLSLQGGGEDLGLMAKPIYYKILVLHRVQRKGSKNKSRKRRYAFRLGTEEIAVGCTCVRPIVVPQQ